MLADLPRSAIVDVSVRITTPQVKIPAAPRPATALPKMSTDILGATPQIRLPSSKTRTAKMIPAFDGKNLRACEYRRFVASMVMKKLSRRVSRVGVGWSLMYSPVRKPWQLIKRSKLVGDLRNSGRQDQLVEREEEDTDAD
jgi:hypothetical protein